MTVILLTAALVAALVAAGVLATVASRRSQRLHAAEDAVVALARSWSEDGSSRGRLCAAAQLVAGGSGAFLAEQTRRGDALRITAAAGIPELVGLEARLNDEDSLLARAFRSTDPLHVTHADLPAAVSERLGDVRVQSGRLLPVLHGTTPIGVLAVGWRTTEPESDDVRNVILDELAAEAGRAIERDAHVALLARQARTDELTALPNRRAWDEAVAREMSRAERTGEPLCLALLDLDHFKAYNDLNGHPAGDAHLRRTAAAWRREVRAIDVLARYGGEEFGVLLPSCEIIEAHEVIDRVRAATPNGQTASAGVVQFDGREHAESLLARADAALYRAKHLGRATTVHA